MLAISKSGTDRRFRPLFRAFYGGTFGRWAERRVLVVYEPRRIAFSQVYPFLMYARAFADRFGAQFRFVTTPAILESGLARRHLDATHVLVQTWLTDPPERIEAVRARLRLLPAEVRRVYLDSFANTDIRFARHLTDFDLYFKKSLPLDRAALLRPTYGHTNLTEFYGRLHGIAQEPTDWQVPPTFLGRLRLAPNFLTAPDLSAAFLGSPPPPQGAGRDIDLHARFGGTVAQNWYGAMRRDAEARVAAFGDVRSVLGAGVPKAAFLAEMRRSKLCFSPFGYGELCWRDIEAMAMGAVLVKPDMSHLETEPDLFRDGETYIAVRWDFADLGEKVYTLLADENWRARIAQTAWQSARAYLDAAGPVNTYADLFALEADGS